MTDSPLQRKVSKSFLAGKIAFLLILVAGMVGCEQGPVVAPVKGVVTLNSVPLANAQIQFQPDTGAPSYADTDENGAYEVKYKTDRMGALLGHHYVSVTTKGEFTDPETDTSRNVPEKIPRIYNDDTTLEFEVKKGDNVFNIDIEGERKPGFDRGF